MPYKLAIFDFDGTLADSAGWMQSVFNDVARRFGFRTLSEADFAMLRGQDNRAIVAHLGVPLWKMPFIAMHMRRRVAENAEHIRLFPGVPELLAQLERAGVALAVVSSNSEENVRRILGPEGAARIRHWGCGAGIFGKAAKFRRVVRLAGVRPAEALSIGDEVRDIEAARAEGIPTAAVCWGYATPELLRSRGPTHVVERVEDLGPLVTT